MKLNGTSNRPLDWAVAPDDVMPSGISAHDPDLRSALLGRDRSLVVRLLIALRESERRVLDATREAERLREDSRRDPLTGLANRRAWEEALEREEERCARFGYSAAVLVIDLDDLKETNDRFGHDAGDRLLAATGRALVESVRAHDMVARIGGDEFVVLLMEADAAAVRTTCERISATLGSAGVRASLGSAVRSRCCSLEDAVRLADERMYEQKHGRELAA